MYILVTGGAGFIGSHVAKALIDAGHDVTVIDDLSSGKKEMVPAGARFVQADISRENINDFLPEVCDAIIHLAAQVDVRRSVVMPLRDAEVNVLGTLRLLEYARDKMVKRFIFSSTGGAIYGDSTNLPTDETEEPHPESPYGAAKLAAEHYIDLFHRLHGVDYVTLRYANVYGPGQSGSKESGVIAIFCQNIKDRKPLTIFGDGQQSRDFVYVDDVVRANLAALESDEVGVFNIGTGEETTLNQLVEELQSLSGGQVKVNYEPKKKGDIMRSCIENKRASHHLEWRPEISLSEGLKRTLDSVA